MQPSEKKIYDARVKLLEIPLRPFIKTCTALGITADMISYAGVALMVAFVLTVQSHPGLGLLLVLARMFADILDGPLARFQQTDSDRGKFVDVLMDNLGFGLFVIGSIKAHLINAVPGVVYLYSTELVVMLMVIRYNFKHRSSWFFYASAGSYPYNFMYASYLAYAIYALGGHNYLNSGAVLFSVLLVIKAVADYSVIQKTAKR